MKNWFRQLQMALARSGKKYRVLKYPILLLLLLMAAICRGIDAVGTLTRPAVRRRVMAAALSVCMVFTMLPMQTFAAKPTQNAGSLCEHHPAHRLECGYTEGTAGSPCTHEHRSDCYIEVTDCTHEHMAECYPEDDSVSDNDATPSDAEEKEPTECSHICDEDTGCITQELDCPHDRGEHDDTCGYAEGTEGTPCTYICDICNPVEDDAEKQILAIAAPKVVQGIEWEIDDTGCLTISTQAGMTDWKDNGKLTNKSNVKTVTIANDVTKIPSQAFEDCTELTSVSAPGAKSIASYAFNRCEKLASVHIPGALSIGSTAFMNCAELTSVTFPVATSIQSYAFAGCKKLASAYIPEAVSIGSNAFDGCAELTSASFPVAKNIMPYAFSGCTTLATLSLPVAPPSVTDTNAFQGCPSPRVLVLVDADGTELTGMALTEAKAAYKAVNDGDTTDNLWYGWIIEEPVADNGWAIDASGNLTITTSEGMTDWVANGLAANKDTVKTATIDVTVTEILSSAFNGCTMLTAVTAKGATIIGDSAFENCKALKSIDFPVVETIGKKAFFYCEALTSASFPKAATIGESAFEYCPALESIDFPVATTIGNKAFSGCTALTSITLSNGVTSIGGQAFKDCNSLATVTMNFSDGKAKTIGSGSFAGTTGATINVVAKDATPKVFKTWSSTTTGGTAATFTSAATATTTLTNVPSNCTITAEYEVPVTKYAVTVTGGTGSGDYAENATVTIAADTPEDGKEFDKWTTTDDVTFADAAAATTTFAMPAKAVTVTASHKAKVNAVEPKITSDLSTTQVTYTVGGTAIALDATATVTDGGIISYDWYSNTTNSNTGGTKLNVTTATYTPLTTTAETTYYYCVVTNTNSAATGTKTAKITSAVANIKVEATSVDKGWEIDASGNLTISTAAGMTDWVANGRDTNKSNLKTATIAKGILSIDKDAFNNCTKLTSVSISDGVTFIGNSAFWGCTKLTSVIIPDSVITIENFAFISTGLTSVTFKSTKPPTLGRTIFLNTPDNLIIYVPQGSVDAYKEVSNLSDMKDKIKVAGLPSESIPTATFTATGSATGTLSNVSTGMKYSTNGTNWTEISSGADIFLTGLNACTISVVKKGDGTTTSDSEAQTISVTQAATPTDVGKTDETVAKNDGTITGVKATMEYKLSASSVYTAISSTTVTGLAPGTYQVRTKATGTVLASADTSVTINAVTLSSIAVTTQPTKTTYIAGESFDKAGMVITAAYSDNSTAVVTDYSVSPSGALAASNTTITISYTKDGITKTADVTITVNDKVNAVAPTISTDLSETEVTYIKDAAATALSISATVSDSGTLSYEWYSNTTNSTTGGTKLTGTAAIYTPSTASVGTTYYYCIVTNTITDNGDGGTKTATATSAVANIKVEATSVDKGWAIDASDNLTISTATGMTGWVENGLDANKDTIKTVTIENTVTEIPKKAFYYCKQLEEVTAPGVTDIGESAFESCTALTSVTANGATNIDSFAFYDCIALTSASFPAAKTIGFYSFRGCEALTSTSFPAAETIGDSAFRVCKALTSTSFPAAETIGKSAFSDCTALTSASFPKVETIGESAFYGCTALTSANFPVAETIGKAAFYDCSKLATLKLPAAPPSAPVASTFEKCPATRALALVNADGTALTGDALTNAQAAYKAVNDGDATDTLWYGWKIDVAPPTTPTVTSVAVTPETASVQQGNTQQFAAAVTGANSPAQTVTWKVTGGKTGTGISVGGLLTVAADETATTLIVTATSTVDTTKSGTATVTVTSTPVTKYTLTVTNGTGGGSYEAGASVTATANAAPSNQHFKKWTATGLTGVMLTNSPLTFQMPEGAVTLTAVYEADPPVVTVDKSALITAIANAKSIMANTVISVQGGADVSRDTYWVLPDIMSAAKSALSEAEAIVVKADGTQAEVDNAAVKLNAKVNIDFKNAKKTGTKSSGNGSGSSSGGSSSGTTPPPSQPVVKIPGTGQATIPTTVDQNGNANVSVTDKNITDAIADAKKDAVQGQPITVEIKVNTDKDASQLITTLPQSVRDTLINNQVGSLTIGSKDVSMNFSQAALGQMNAQAQGNLSITATKADTGKITGNAQTLIGNRPTYEFKATCDGRIITDLGVNAVTITIPYILKEGETAANIQAIRMDANGVATVVPGSVYDVTKQAVVFTTGQVSAIYGIGYGKTTASSIHRVQRGETLAAIARRYQTTVQAIAALNGISNPNRIEIGQEIQIPK